VVATELRGVLDDHADPARELEVLEQERDAHGRLSYGRVRRDDLPSTRVAFVGDAATYGPHLLHAPAGGVAPTLVAPGDTDALRAADPDVVVAFRPETLPPDQLRATPAPVLGVITDPLPRADREPHPAYDAALDALRTLDPSSVDRLITTDANSWDAAAALGLPLWRAMPLPVDDRLYRAPRPTRRPPRVIALGAPTPHRDEVLAGPLRDFPDAIARDITALHDADTALNIHAERWIRAFEPTVLVHLAAGHLVITEVLEPLYGLEPGLDVVMVGDHYELDLRVHQLFKTPAMYDRVRIRGHHKSRQFAASTVWPRVIADLHADLTAFASCPSN
jgi:hypothetical protein